MNPLRKFNIRGGYGLLSSGRKRSALVSAAADQAELKPVDWSRLFIPTYNQRGPSCASEASCNIIEAMLRFYHGRDVLTEGEQLDGYAVHQVMADLFNAGDVEQGAMLNWPYEAMLKMGLLPPETRLIEIQPTLPAMVAALQNGPLLQGLWVGPAWSAANAVNGQIPENWPIDTNDPEQGGHATVITAYEPRDSVHWLPLVNSWGMEFGWKGTAVLSWEEWEREFEPLGDGPYQFEFGNDFAKFDGWRKYVIRKYT